MALFGSLFEKKNCAICGKELGVFGKTKIADGHLCRDCNDKLSPFFKGRRSSSTEDIRQQLAYREQNERELASFNPTTTIDGGEKKVYLDEGTGRLVISGSSNWRQDNPDLIEFAQVTGCNQEVAETKTELYRTNAEGEKVSYNPPRYDIDYDIYVEVYFSHPYFSEVRWKVNRSRIEQQNSAEYRDAQQKADAVCAALSGKHAEVRAAAAPKRAVACPNCLATTMPDANGCCEYCGSSLRNVIEDPQETPSPYTTYGAQGFAQQAYGQQQAYQRQAQAQVQSQERDWGEGQSYGSASDAPRQQQRPRATGQAKADFRRRQSQ